MKYSDWQQGYAAGVKEAMEASKDLIVKLVDNAQDPEYLSRNELELREMLLFLNKSLKLANTVLTDPSNIE